jgi:hypothetical protein
MPVEKPVKEVEALEAEFSKDEATGKMTANVVIIKAGRAKNPRNYRPSALQKAAREGVYNGMRMFVDHSDKPPVKRSFGEMVSAVESTTWDPTIKPQGGIRGNIEFFDEKFFDQAQRAKKYIGVSADHRIRVIPAQEGQKTIEDVLEIAFARSVDWVLYPSAGGEILSFARESEGEDQVEWSEVTIDALKANAPQLIEQIKSEVVPVKEEVEDDAPPTPTREQIAAMITQGVQEGVQQIADQNAKKAATAKNIREYVAKSGLPARVQGRVSAQFADALEFVEDDVKMAVEDAKEELKELGVGPTIKGEGPSGAAGGGGKPKNTDAREGVESIFGFEKKKD